MWVGQKDRNGKDTLRSMTEILVRIATIASPLIGVAAIFTALRISRRSTKKMQQQVNAVVNLQEVLVAERYPQMLESKRQLESRLAELDEEINRVESQVITSNPLRGTGEDQVIVELSKSIKQSNLENLKRERAEVLEKLNLIKDYINKAKKS